MNFGDVITGTRLEVYKVDNLNVGDISNLVTVIVRSFNGEKFISRALQSILENDYRPLEIIIIFDRGTQDNVINPIEKFLEAHKSDKDILIKVIAHNNSSPFRSLQTGLNNVAKESKYVFFLDYDNIFYANKIKTQLKYMTEHRLDFSFSNQYIIDEKENKIRLFLGKRIRTDLNSELFGNMIDINAICISTDLIPSLFRYFAAISEQTFDWIFEDWLIGLILVGTLKRKDLYIDLPLGGYRVHSGNITSDVVSNSPIKTLKSYERMILTYMAFLKMVNKYSEYFNVNLSKEFKYMAFLKITDSKIKIIGSFIGPKFFIKQVRYLLIKIFSILKRKIFRM